MMAPVASDAANTTGILVIPTWCICSTVVCKLVKAPGMFLNNSQMNKMYSTTLCRKCLTARPRPSAILFVSEINLDRYFFTFAVVFFVFGGALIAFL